jgi:hypothetical protein
MTDTVQDGTLRTRRSLLTAAAGGAAALAVGAIKPAAVAAAPAPMLTETNNAAIAPTGVTNSTADSTALFGTGSTGIGLRGHSTDSSDPEANASNAGVVGIAGDIANVNPNIALTGVYGVSDASPVPEVVAAAGVWGESGDWGVIGSGSGGVLGDGVIGVLGATATPDGVGVLGVSDAPGSFGLIVEGRAMFSRSGRATVSAGRNKRVVTLPGCTAATLVLAVLAQNRAGRFVRAAVPESGKFTIYLNANVASNTKVTWIAFSNPATATG